MQSRVTIIIPTFNRARSVSRAIDSALGQTHAEVDVVVVDDGSTDDTSDVLRRYQRNPRVRVLRHVANRGTSAAINTGLAQLPDETAYFGLLGSDDALNADGVARLVAVFETTGSSYSQVLGWCRDMATGESAGQMAHLPLREGLVTYEDALAGRFTGDFWHLVRRDALGPLRFDERARGSEGAVWWRLLRDRPAWLSSATVYEVDRSGDDRLSRVNYGREVAIGKMWARHCFLVAVGRDLRLRYPGAFAGELADLAKWAALAGDSRRARAASRLAFRSAPSRRTLLITLAVLAPRPLLRWVAEGTQGFRLRDGRP